MRILLLTETWPWPPDSGGRVKTSTTLDVLGRVHEVHLHAFVRTRREAPDVEWLSRRCASITRHVVERSLPGEAADAARAWLAGRPFTLARHWRRRVARRVAAASRDLAPDLVYCDHLSMLWYGLPLGRPVLYDAHNVEHALVSRYAASNPGTLRGALAWYESRRLATYEAGACRQGRVVTAVSDIDATALRALAGPGPSIVTVPIAIDPARYPSRVQAATAPLVLFVGGLHWPPNEEAVRHFVRDIWPVVRATRPDASALVVGRVSDRQRAEFTRDGVRLTGYVDDVGDAFARARVMVVPLLSGGGMRVKVLEALARGVPVVSSTVGVEGIEVVHGRDALVVDGAGALASALVRVLTDDGTAMALAANGRRLVEARYSVEAVAIGLLAAVAKAASGATAKG